MHRTVTPGFSPEIDAALVALRAEITPAQAATVIGLLLKLEHLTASRTLDREAEIMGRIYGDMGADAARVRHFWLDANDAYCEKDCPVCHPVHHAPRAARVTRHRCCRATR